MPSGRWWPSEGGKETSTVCPFIFYGNHQPESWIGGILSWQEYLAERGGWFGLWYRGEKHYIRNPLDGLAHRVRHLLGISEPKALAQIETGHHLVFPPEFVVMGGTLRKLPRGERPPLGLIPLESRPGIYGLRGWVIRGPILPGEGWLVNCGPFSGFTLAETPEPIHRGDYVTALVQLRAHGDWLVSVTLLRALLRREDLIPYWRWEVEEAGWSELGPAHPEQKSLVYASFHGAGPTPNARLICHCLGRVEPPARHWGAFMIERAAS
jgi:hypothetical protein